MGYLRDVLTLIHKNLFYNEQILATLRLMINDCKLQRQWQLTPITVNHISKFMIFILVAIVLLTHDLVTHVYLWIEPLQKSENKNIILQWIINTKWSNKVDCNYIIHFRHKVGFKHQSKHEKFNFGYLLVIQAEALISTTLSISTPSTTSLLKSLKRILFPWFQIN